MLAYRWLRQVDSLRGLRETLQIDYLAENYQPVDIHHLTSFRRIRAFFLCNLPQNRPIPAR
jgi:hypothetical protein